MKRVSGAYQQQGLLPSYGPVEPNGNVGQLSGLDLSGLAVPGQIPVENIASLHTELLGQSSGSLAVPAMDQSVLRQASVQGPSRIPVERGIGFGSTLMNSQTNKSKPLPGSSMAAKDILSCFPNLSSSNLGARVSSSDLVRVNTQKSGLLEQTVQQQSQHSVLSESRHAISMQPSCLLVPNQSLNSLMVGHNATRMSNNSLVVSSQPSSSFQVPKNLSFMNQNSIIVPSHSPSSFEAGNAPVPRNQSSSYNIGNPIFNDAGVLNSLTVPGSTSSSASACTDSSTNWPLQTPDAYDGPRSSYSCLASSVYQMQNSGPVAGTLIDQELRRNLGFGARDPCILREHAVDDTLDNINQRDNDRGGDRNTEARHPFGFYRKV